MFVPAARRLRERNALLSMWRFGNLHAFSSSSSSSLTSCCRHSKNDFFLENQWLPLTGRGSSCLSPRRQAARFDRRMRMSSDGATEEESPSERPVVYSLKRRSGVRNVAIVAHVDHGKTTLVDELLKAAERADASPQPEDDSSLNRVMDSGELEKERGITITSKVTRLDHRGTVINVVDTPGHADFAGEVDRILSMVDGVCLLVDAAEGPKSQTKYVLSRALQLGLVPICILNKADRSEALGRMDETESELLDLFDNLGANETQMNYATLYASARAGWATASLDTAVALATSSPTVDEDVTISVVLQAILDNIPAPAVHCYKTIPDDLHHGQVYSDDRFSMAATTVGYDPYLGRTCTGRIYSGSVGVNDTVSVLKRDLSDHANAPSSVVTGIFVNRGISRTPLNSPRAMAGDIVTLAGIPDFIKVGDSLMSTSNPIPSPIQTPPLAPPTLSCYFGANNGPLVGQEGTIVTSSRIRARLESETDNNVTISVMKSASDSEKTVVLGRGELQLGILIEQMRREGHEFLVSPPKIVTKECPATGKTLEPFEEVVVDVDAEYSGNVIDALTGARKGVLMEMADNTSDGKTRLVFHVPSRGLLGFGPEIANTTRGTAVVHHCYVDDRVWAGTLGVGLEKWKLVSNDFGKASMYALSSLAERGTLFIAPGDMVYPGMVVGENLKSGDMEVNPVRAKQVTNIRSVNKEERMYLPPPKKMTVEELIGYMNEDEVIEVTPKSVRLRKTELDSGERQRAARSRKKRMDALKANASGGRK